MTVPNLRGGHTVSSCHEPHPSEDSPNLVTLSPKTQILVLIAGLLAVFLGALDALIIGAAMPTIVAELGGLALYSWVFTSYMLTRAVALPIFGKLADLYSTKTLFGIAVGLFLVGSILSGLSSTMLQLIVMRAVQGAGAGANFALAYIMVAEISTPDQRGRRMGYISFAMFALLAFLPLFIQGVLCMSAVKTGLFMVPVSVGWSAGGLLGGQLINRLGNKVLSTVGAFLMLTGSLLTLGFGPGMGLFHYQFVVAMIGLGMGFVTVGTLIAVQESLSQRDLGVATSSNQFARSLGGTVGVGIAGSLAAHRMDAILEGLEPVRGEIPTGLMDGIRENLQQLLRPEALESVPLAMVGPIRKAVAGGVEAVFWAALVACLINGLFCIGLPKDSDHRYPR